MAQLFFTGFEGITTAQLARRFVGASAVGGVGTSYGRNGSQGLYTTGVDTPIVTGTTDGTVFFGTALQIFERYTSGGNFIKFMGGGNQHCAIQQKTGTTYQAVDAAGAYVGSTFTLTDKVWYYLEVKVVVSDTVGVIEVRVDGTVVSNATGLDTKNGATAYVDTVKLGTNSTNQYWDDLYINDSTGAAPHNTYYGDVQVVRVDTLADSTVQFTPLSSTNESNIDDGNTPDDDTTYNSSSTVNNKDLFTISGYAAPSGTGGILGVMVRAVARMDSGARTVRAIGKVSATQANGTAATLASAYQEYACLMTNDPNTGAAWANAAAVNAALIGYEITA